MKLIDLKITELTYNEQTFINGGNPRSETGFWYDVAWWIGACIRFRNEVGWGPASSMIL